MPEPFTFDEVHFPGGWVKAVETETGQFVLRSQAQLRAEFLKRLQAMGQGHDAHCTGWCQCEILELAHAARSAFIRSVMV